MEVYQLWSDNTNNTNYNTNHNTNHNTNPNTNNNTDNTDNDDSNLDSTSVFEDPDLSPQAQLIVQNLYFEDCINKELQQMRGNMEILQLTFGSVSKISSYTPLHPEKFPKWQESLIPAMKQCLVQDVLMRKGIREANGLLRDLAIKLMKGSELIMNEKGSPESVAIVVEQLEIAFKKLADAKQKLKELDFSILKVFEDNTGMILSQAGSKRANDILVKKEELISRLKKQQRILERMDQEKNKIVGLIAQFQNYICAMELMRDNKDQGIREMREQRAQLQTEITALNAKMEKVPLFNKKEVVLSYRKVLFRRQRTTVSLVRNENRESEVNFLKGIASERLSQADTILNHEERREAQLKALTKEIAEAKSKLASLQKKLDNLEQKVDVKFVNCTGEIDAIFKEMDELDKEADDMHNCYGLKGSTLVEFLAELRVFLQTTKNGASIIQPILSLLGNVESLFEIPFKSLKGSNNPRSVFMSGNLMIKELGFIKSLYENLPQLLITPNQTESNLLQKMLNGH